MRIPEKLPGLRLFTILVAIYGIVWISLEGDLARVIILAASMAIVAVGYLVQRYLGGRSLSLGAWLATATAIGLLVGLGSGFLTPVFMALKTGLHAHGPEFRQAEFAWVISQILLWGAAGAVAGLGLGLLAAELSRSS